MTAKTYLMIDLTSPKILIDFEDLENLLDILNRDHNTGVYENNYKVQTDFAAEERKSLTAFHTVLFQVADVESADRDVKP